MNAFRLGARARTNDKMNVINQSGDMGKRNRMRSRKDMRAKKGKEPGPRRHAGASLLARSAERRTEERKREKEASRKRVVVVVVVVEGGAYPRDAIWIPYLA